MRLTAALAAAFALASLASLGGGPPALTVAGSTGLLRPAVTAAARLAREGERVHVLPGGSLFGLDLVREGHVEVALSEVAGPGLWRRRLGVVRILVVAQRDTGVRSLTLADLRGIVSGAVTRWDEIGGSAEPVTLIFRTAPSGLRIQVLGRLFGEVPEVGRAVGALSNGDALASLRRTPGGIAFIEGNGPARGLRVLQVDGKRPDEAGYPLAFPAYAFLRRPPGPTARRFLDLVVAELR